ncbi:uncharacterized protein BX664DRAFT_360356 [Halteromyces radiatus]|uniref:uncharacterized protein n=1 Tax=Halteromyces radiatus TaxID=101107 RepID=UPI00221F50AD|nr:uncharacterized protein BX664DRAFT_360356 [Halteromyces radiatus]KAI8084489.1 hypothetical protein BX664DRAFT_360356 [Halteromyces radiatus]
MHPAAIVFIVVGGIACLWGGYEAGSKIFDWISFRREQRRYEDYIRHYHEEKQVFYSSPPSYDDDDDDAIPLSSASYNQNKEDLENMARQLEERRHALQQQRQLLEQEERQLRQRRIHQRGNSLMGWNKEDDINMSSFPRTQSISSSNQTWSSVQPSSDTTQQLSSDDRLSVEDDAFGVLSLASSFEDHPSENKPKAT